MPGLDGLRALSVLAVIAYHLNLPFAPGGLLGVNIFFVLSGYLITDILLDQWRQDRRLDLRNFWLRRARRLLPALFLMLVAVVVWLALVDRAQLPSLRGDIVAAALYVSNWWLIFHHVSYFARFGPPSPLTNLWSLAVEEQFYLVWPLLLAFGLRFVRRKGWLIGLILAGATVSAGAMAVIYQPGVDPSRVYYGTDTRAFSLLIGAALAVAWASHTLRTELPARARRLLDGSGVAALLIVLAMIVFTNEYQTFLYRGGMVLLSIASAVVIAVLAHPASRLGALFGRQPLRWLGVRSYGIYLWHYPVIVLTSTAVNTGGFDAPRALLQVAATLVLADLSWRFVETPIRRGGVGRLWARINRTADPRKVRRFALATAVLLAASILGAGLMGNVSRTAAIAAPAPAGTPAASLPAKTAEAPADPAAHAPHAASTTDAAHAAHTASAPVSATGSQYAARFTATPALATAARGASYGRSRTTGGGTRELLAAAALRRRQFGKTVTAVGDSIMIDLQPYLQRFLPGIVVDGVVGRQMYDLGTTLEQLKKRGELRPRLVIELGTNGSFQKGQLVALLRSLHERQIILANTRVPRPWQSVVNTMLAQVAREVPHTTLVNWFAASANHNSYFYPDGVHPDPQGARVYAALIAHALTGRAVK